MFVFNKLVVVENFVECENDKCFIGFYVKIKYVDGRDVEFGVKEFENCVVDN